MSSNLYKAGWVVVNDDARVIDTNELMERKLKAISTSYRKPVQEEYDNGDDEFSTGLDVDRVDALFDSDSEGAVLKSASMAEQFMDEQENLDMELESARNELEQTKAQVQQMLEDTQADLEEMKAKAFEEASEQGYRDGYEKGMDEVRSMQEECLSKQKQLEDEYFKKIEELEPEFVEALTGIYEHIFKVDLQGYHQLVVDLLINAMRKVEGIGNVIVHVSKEEFQVVMEAKGRILEETGTLSERLEIISDMTLSASQCMIETEGGIYDCSLGIELEELSRKLKLLSYKGGK